MAFDQISLKGRALRLLAGREHSRSELQRKLSAHETEPGELAKALDELEAKGFINEQRVLESVVHRRAARLGAARVRQELHAKGLDPQAVAQAVAGLQDSEETRAREVWRKKFGETPSDAAAVGKQMRFLLTRGFGADVARRVVRGAPDDDNEG
ncbi:recombination regulator RecX [Hydrogenophaga sp. BPS33]|uniref:recombination regulator RecX n=1 Tax=Hydrogenophaga sp. BPS33 TaxID=2651974 RepID=UPI00131F95F3|nr:recombination regulator RecX [Hydrogenophaga sp. BPS33]QHE88627.1 recombination regulator RecX [Hydrogenophaga sp. BPS33]